MTIHSLVNSLNLAAAEKDALTSYFIELTDSEIDCRSELSCFKPGPEFALTFLESLARRLAALSEGELKKMFSLYSKAAPDEKVLLLNLIVLNQVTAPSVGWFKKTFVMVNNALGARYATQFKKCFASRLFAINDIDETSLFSKALNVNQIVERVYQGKENIVLIKASTGQSQFIAKVLPLTSESKREIEVSRLALGYYPDFACEVEDFSIDERNQLAVIVQPSLNPTRSIGAEQVVALTRVMQLNNSLWESNFSTLVATREKINKANLRYTDIKRLITSLAKRYAWERVFYLLHKKLQSAPHLMSANLVTRLQGWAFQAKIWNCIKANVVKVALHGDLHQGNLLEDEKGGLKLIDWGSTYNGYAVTDLALFSSVGKLSKDEIDLVLSNLLRDEAFNIFDEILFLLSLLLFNLRKQSPTGNEKKNLNYLLEALISRIESVYKSS